jgi:hypothetical protein
MRRPAGGKESGNFPKFLGRPPCVPFRELKEVCILKKNVLLLLIVILMPTALTIREVDATTYQFQAKYFSDNGTGSLGAVDEDYESAHNRGSAQAMRDDVWVGQYLSSTSGYPTILRGFLTFDTSTLPDDRTIASAVLKILCVGKLVDQNAFDIIVQTGGGEQPHIPLELGDYWYGYYSSNGGAYPAQMAPVGDFVMIQLNSNGINSINKTGLTKLVLRSSKDISAIPPNNNEFLKFSWYDIYLEVSLENPPPPLVASVSPAFVVMEVGTTQTFTCSASGGSGTYSYKWFVNGQDTGVTASQYAFTATSQNMGTNVSISCSVGDGTGIYVSTAAIAKVKIPHGKIAVSEVSSEKMRICAELYHDGQESIPDKDYYAVLVTVEDLKYKNSGGWFGLGQIHPFETVVMLEMNNWCDEFPANHQPTQGDYGSSQTSIGFSGGGLSYSIHGSAYRVFFDKWRTADKFYCKWTLKWGILLFEFIGTGFPWIDYVQFAIQISVPAEFKPTVNIGVKNCWDQEDILGYWRYDSDELWTQVDPPGAETIPPPEPITIPSEGTVQKPEATREVVIYEKGLYQEYKLIVIEIKVTFWRSNYGYVTRKSVGRILV